MVCKVGGSTPPDNLFNCGDYSKKPQEVNQQSQDLPSIFGFKDNGDGIVNKQDFSDADMLKFAEKNGFIGKKWSEVTDLTKSYIESKDPKKALQNTLSDIENGNVVASVQFGEEDPILGINTSPVFNVAVKDDKVVLTPFKNGQKGTPIEMTKEEFIEKCAKENGVMNIVKKDSQQIEE